MFIHTHVCVKSCYLKRPRLSCHIFSHLYGFLWFKQKGSRIFTYIIEKYSGICNSKAHKILVPAFVASGTNHHLLCFDKISISTCRYVYVYAPEDRSITGRYHVSIYELEVFGQLPSVIPPRVPSVCTNGKVDWITPSLLTASFKLSVIIDGPKRH